MNYQIISLRWRTRLTVLLSKNIEIVHSKNRIKGKNLIVGNKNPEYLQDLRLKINVAIVKLDR